MITKTARLSMNEEAALRNKIKTCNDEALMLKCEKGNNSICRVKEIIEKIVRKSNRVEHLRNEDQEGRTYSESIRVKEKESRRNQVIYTVNIDRTKSRLLINDPQTQSSY